MTEKNEVSVSSTWIKLLDRFSDEVFNTASVFLFCSKYAHLVFVVSDETSTNNYAATHANMTKAHYQPIGSPIDISKFDMEYIKRKIENRKDVESKKFLYTGRLSKIKMSSYL